MTILLEDETDQVLARESGSDCRELIGQVAEQALSHEGCPYEVQLEVLITGEDEIHELNRDYRGVDSATDVLSFPMIDFEKPGDFSVCELSENEADYFDPDSGELVLGNIVLNASRVITQAKEYGHSVKREFAFLVAHSMFHLMGYDHMEPEEEAVMIKKQEAVLDALGIRR